LMLPADRPRGLVRGTQRHLMALHPSDRVTII
jgi:hypothetical protein